MNILKEQYSRKLSENMDEDQVEVLKKYKIYIHEHTFIKL